MSNWQGKAVQRCHLTQGSHGNILYHPGPLGCPTTNTASKHTLHTHTHTLAEAKRLHMLTETGCVCVHDSVHMKVNEYVCAHIHYVYICSFFILSDYAMLYAVVYTSVRSLSMLGNSKGVQTYLNLHST